MLTPRPLYALPELRQDKGQATGRPFVTEGEKAADAVRSLGLTATTSAGGSKAAHKSDWTPLAGREVVILPDNDESGRDYAAAVAGILAALDPPAAVRLVELPGLPDKGDAADWCEANTAADPQTLADRLCALADDAPPWTPPPRDDGSVLRADAVLAWTPFPVKVLPPAVRRFIVEAAAGIGCDPSFVALPLLAALAGAIGNARRVRLRGDWCEPAILWTVTVGESGSQKSPAFAAALAPVEDRQRQAFKAFDEAHKEWEPQRAAYELARKAWERNRDADSPPPEPPAEPVLTSYRINDCTVEAVGAILRDNPRGTLCAVEELAAWFGMFDRYAKGGKGADAPKWLGMHGGSSLRIDRRNSPRPLFVPRAAVSVTGTVQPGTLRRLLGVEHRESGMAARLLWAWPPRRQKRWSDAEVSTAAKAGIADLFARLYALELATAPDGDPCPVDVPLSPAARRDFKRFVDEHGEEHAELTGELAAAWSKLEGGAARLALIVHSCRAVAGDADPAAVDAGSVAAGVTLARWFAAEARRVYALLDEDELARRLRELAEWIERKHGGDVTTRQVQTGRRELGTADDAEARLNALADAGFGRWIDRPTDPAKGGRPTRAFRLYATHPDDENAPAATPDATTAVCTTPATPAVIGVVLTLTPQTPPETSADALPDDCTDAAPTGDMTAPAPARLAEPAPDDADDWEYV